MKNENCLGRRGLQRNFVDENVDSVVDDEKYGCSRCREKIILNGDVFLTEEDKNSA